MLDVAYFADLITVVLKDSLFPDLDRAVPLLLGTAAQESGLQHTRQLGGGPALGYFQMEPTTARDHATWFHGHTVMQAHCVTRTGVARFTMEALEHNVLYGIMLARLHYYVRSAARLPAPTDLIGQGTLWKRVYNTPGGAGTPAQYAAAYERLIAPRWQA